jgi:hypothetical protein
LNKRELEQANNVTVQNNNRKMPNMKGKKGPKDINVVRVGNKHNWEDSLHNFVALTTKQH